MGVDQPGEDGGAMAVDDLCRRADPGRDLAVRADRRDAAARHGDGPGPRLPRIAGPDSGIADGQVGLGSGSGEASRREKENAGDDECAAAADSPWHQRLSVKIDTVRTVAKLTQRI